MQSIRRSLLIACAAVALAVGLSGCGPSGPQPPLDPNAPVTQGQLAQQQQSPAANGALWGLGGFLLGRMTASRPAATYAAPVAAPPTVVHQTVVKKTIINNNAPKVEPPKPTTTPKYTPPPPRVSRTYTAPSRSFSAPRSFSGGRR